MSKYVKVSSISISPCELIKKPDNQTIAEYVISHLEENISQVLPDKPDLIVLPEVCDRPVGIKSIEERFSYYKERGNAVLKFLQKTAKENNCYITYPAQIYLEDGTLRNVITMVDRKGEITGTYHKNYPTISENENVLIRSGKTAEIFECDFGRVAAAICFDLNFDEYRLRVKKEKPDMIVFCSNFHGGILQNFFAYDTRSYLVSAIGFSHIQGSIVSPVGETIRHSTTYCNYITEVLNMDYAVCHLDYNIDILPKIKEKYGSDVKIYDPGNLGSVLISSESDKFTAMDIVNEFNIELLDDYLMRSVMTRNKHLED